MGDSQIELIAKYSKTISKTGHNNLLQQFEDISAQSPLCFIMLGFFSLFQKTDITENRKKYHCVLSKLQIKIPKELFTGGTALHELLPCMISHETVYTVLTCSST